MLRVPIGDLMVKNTAAKVEILAWDTVSDVAKTGDAANITAKISKDGGASASSNDVNPTELDATNHPGIYIFDITAAEANCDLFILSAKSTTSGINIWPVRIRTIHHKLASDGLDAITVTEPTTKPTNFREWLLWLVQRFRRAEMTPTTLTVKTESGTVITQQTLTDNGAVQTISAPS